MTARGRWPGLLRFVVPEGVLALFFGMIAVVLATGCSGKKDGPATQTPTAGESTEDALALLPAGAIAVGTIDGRAFFSSQSFGAELAQLLEKYVPIGPEAGFQASRDVDRVTFASYSYQGIDAAAIVVGRFDEAKIKEVAAKHIPTKGGAVIVASPYAGRDVYTVGNVGFTLLSPTKAIAGTEAGIRRVLDRIRDKRVKREMASWMLQTVETPGASAAVAADLATNPVPAELARQVPLPIFNNVKAVRLVATFKEPGLNVAGSLTYPDAAAAQNGASVVKKGLAIVGVVLRMQKADIAVEQADVQLKLAIDDQALRALLGSMKTFLGP